MSVFQSILLAIVEGLTEFLPVSSTGHMIIVASVMGIATDPFTKAFIVAIQLGAILSVVVLYWKKFIPTNGEWKPAGMFYLKLFVAFLPAMVLGFLLDDIIDILLERVEAVAISLILGGIVFLFVDKLFQENERTGETNPSFMSAFVIGLFQTIAMAPGVSRSAASIIGGLTQKMTRTAAAEFSFYLAVPTMAAATTYKLFKFYKGGYTFGQEQLILLAVGNIVAFVVAIIAIKSFIGFLSRHGFKVFGYYRILIGLAILLLYLFGVPLSII